MTQILKLELPDEAIPPMQEAAQRSGKTLETWAAEQLRCAAPTKSEREQALARLLQYTVDAPDAVGADNESIDRDLCREYARGLDEGN